MKNIDWHEIKFLESSGNVKKLVKEAIGKEPSSKIASDISVCIQQGRMFFETALNTPLEIRPLQIFYGMLGFARAVHLARNLKSLDTLKAAHGLKDISPNNSSIKDLKLKIDCAGTFQDFNDSISKLSGIYYFGKSAMPQWKFVPFSESSNLSGLNITLKEILARTPYLQHLYQKTFDEEAKTWYLMFDYHDKYNNYANIRIDDPEIYTDRKSLKSLVEKWRNNYPFLKNWCIEEATKAWGNSIIYFCNLDKSSIDEFSDEFLSVSDGHFTHTNDQRRNKTLRRIDFKTIIQPIAGGITRKEQYLIAPLDGNYLSEYTLHYLGMFLLSSLVRYRPQTWVHAISRSFTHDSPADDKALALIERFMEIVLEHYPTMVTESIGLRADGVRA